MTGETAALTICEQCAANATRAVVSLCGPCAQSFRVIYLPDDVRTWEEIARDAHGDNGAAIEEFIKGLQIRIFNQQRELSKLNRRAGEERAKFDAVMKRLADAAQKPVSPDILDIATRYIRRYAWLRDGNGYAPEEGFARGGDQLDKLCDDEIREHHGATA